MPTPRRALAECCAGPQRPQVVRLPPVRMSPPAPASFEEVLRTQLQTTWQALLTEHDREMALLRRQGDEAASADQADTVVRELFCEMSSSGQLETEVQLLRSEIQKLSEQLQEVAGTSGALVRDDVSQGEFDEEERGTSSSACITSLEVATTDRDPPPRQSRRVRISRVGSFDIATKKRISVEKSKFKHLNPVSKRQSFKSSLPERIWNMTADASEDRICEYFDYTMGVFLMLNALAMGIRANHMAANPSPRPPVVFVAIDVVFCIIFSLELSLRVWASGCPRFWSWKTEGWKWNWFDTVVVIVTVVDEVFKAIMLTSETGDGTQDVFNRIGLLRMLRLVRVLRLIRLVRLVPELKSMVFLIVASMGSFFWACTLLSVLMYIFAVYFTEYVADLRLQHPEEDLTDVMRHWGDIGTSTMSLFMAITGGDDWRNLIDPFLKTQSSYFLNALLISCYVAFATLVMLNLVTGVFVEGAQRIVREDKQNMLMKLAAQVLAKAGMDGDEKILAEDFQKLLDCGLLDTLLKEIGVHKSAAENLFYVFDEDNSGDVSLIEFVGGCLRMNGMAKTSDLAFLDYNQNLYFHETMQLCKQMSEDLAAMRAETSRR